MLNIALGSRALCSSSLSNVNCHISCLSLSCLMLQINKECNFVVAAYYIAIITTLTVHVFKILNHFIFRNPWGCIQLVSNEDDIKEDGWWHLYDTLWVLISEMNGKGPSKTFAKGSITGCPTFGQRARGLVESLNIPAAEMAAVVVSGGIGNALSGKSSKYVDKAMLLRVEKCPRIVFHLLVLYLCESNLERASRCVQQFISLLPCLLTADDEQSRTRLHLLLWYVVMHYSISCTKKGK